MRRISALLICLAATCLFAFQTQDEKPARHAACFAPGTPQEIVDAWTTLGLNTANRYEFEDFDRWSRTATDGSGLQPGEPTTLTWGVVPDGTWIPGFNGENAAASDLRARLNTIFPGGENQWLPLFQQVFDRISELSGITYVYEPNDDSADFSNFSSAAPGVLGVRPDIRIGGHPLDGNFGLLGYNFFPNNGEMVLDTIDNAFASADNNYRLFRNTLSHEHGHGLGFSHVCPIDDTKLMEPFLGTAFDGPQHDDILAIHRGYGDALEDNDTYTTATNLGTLTASGYSSSEAVSVDSSDDDDFYRFQLNSPFNFNAQLQPTGVSYQAGPQVGNCNTGDQISTLVNMDIGFILLASDGQTEIVNADNGGVGELETIDTSLAPGVYYLQVYAAGVLDDVQNYELDLNLTLGSLCDFNEVLLGWNNGYQSCLGANLTMLELVAAVNDGTIVDPSL